MFLVRACSRTLHGRVVTLSDITTQWRPSKPGMQGAHRLQLRLAHVADPRAVDDDVAHRRLVHVRHHALRSHICDSSCDHMMHKKFEC